MTVRVPVEVPGRAAAYQIAVGEDALRELPALLAERFAGDRVAAVADAEALRLHRARLVAALPADTPLIEVPAGEDCKSRSEKERVEDELLSRRFGRDSVIVGFGGGAATDLAGFVAATYLRGVPFVALPTTLLAAVDASVGGKTGINTPHGKNLIGAIRQPAAVFADIGVLDTLSPGEYGNGLAEAIKMAATSDEALFAEIEANIEALLRREADALTRLIAASVRIKAQVVARDELEGGLRQVLNFGHTIAHGIEHASGYRFPHGAAVAVGMVAESRMARSSGFLSSADEDRLDALLGEAGLPRTAPDEVTRAAVLNALGSDKKTRGGEARFVMLQAIGRVRSEQEDGHAAYSFAMPSEVVDAGLSAIGL